MSDSDDASGVNLGFETFSGTLAKFVTTVIGFVGTIVFARLLGPNDFGTYYLFLAIVDVANRPLFGWVISGKKRFSEHISQRNRDEILGALLLGAALSIFVALFGAIMLDEWLRSYVNEEESTLLFSVLFFATAFYLVFQRCTEARGRVSIAMWSETLKTLTGVPIQTLLVLVGWSVSGMIFGYVTAMFLTVPVMAYYTSAVPAFPSKAQVQSLWIYARYSIPSSIVGTTYTRFDILLLGMMISPAAAGYYEVAFRVSMPATFVALVAGNTLMSRVSNASSRGWDTAEDVSNTLAFSSVLALPILFGAVAIAEELIITFYGSAYTEAGTLLIGLTAFRVVESQSSILGKVTDGLDRPDISLRVDSLSLGFNILLGVFLTIQFGPIGVVVATILAELLRYAGYYRFLRSQFRRSTLFPREIIAQGSAAVIMFVVVVLTDQIVRIDRYYHLLLILFLGASVYTGALLVLSSKFRTALRASLKDQPF